MFCDECGENPATTHYTKIVNGKKNEFHLCESCAKQHKEFGFDSPFSIHQLLAGLLDNITDGNKKKENIEEFKCNLCGTTYLKFKQSGKFGCNNCYESFRQQLYPLFKRIHGHENHIGKIPKKTGGEIKLKREIDTLKLKLSIAVEKEEFEIAVKFRDKIKELQRDINE